MQYHLLKANGKWQLRESGSDEAVYSASTKADALEALQDYMDDHDGSVTIHRADGSFQENRRYSTDASSSSLSGKAWGIVGTVAVAASTAALVAWKFRDRLPVDRLRLPGRN